MLFGNFVHMDYRYVKKIKKEKIQRCEEENNGNKVFGL